MEISDVPAAVTPFTRMDEIDEWVESLKKTQFINPDNISGWGFSEEYFNEVLSKIWWPPKNHSFNYSYSWELGIPKKIAKKLNLSDEMDCIITANSSQAIMLLSLLASKTNKEVNICAPFYWSIRENVQFFGSSTVIDYLDKDSKKEYISNKKYTGKDLVWVTNPPFSTGGTLSNDFIKSIDKLAGDGGIAFFDEALCDPLSSVLMKFKNHKNLFSILSPHKYLNTNGKKFSIIIFPKKYKQFFIETSDSLLGSIPSSTIDAAEHFLSDNYDIVYQSFKKWVHQANTDISLLIRRHKGIKASDNTDGIYKEVSVPGISHDFLDDRKKMQDLIIASNAYLIPGTKSYRNPDHGFCFRINLAKNNSKYISAVDRVLNYFESQL